MSTTPQDIIDAALAKNQKNTPDVSASDTELFDAFKRIYPVFWTIGARVNRTFFGKSDTVTGSGGTWARPSDAEMIFRIQNQSGDQVIVVDLEETDAEPETPAVYEWGQSFTKAGETTDPGDTDVLEFYYSKIPDTPSSVSDTLEALWPEHFNELLVLELAMVLAAKDDRDDEVARLRPERDAWLGRFIAHLEHATVGVVSSKDRHRFTAQSIVALDSMLTGGTEVGL